MYLRSKVINVVMDSKSANDYLKTSMKRLDYHLSLLDQPAQIAFYWKCLRSGNDGTFWVDDMLQRKELPSLLSTASEVEQQWGPPALPA